ncbi:hypothetical protein HMN09_01211100 [Mycena chlorophos]|uniref:Uncharacterized protein n=1 Tax=Mycena chlorophos TaxID=658473 RepID=A0A8H6S6J7_MYCCL|nr:hypothetical protein HMN09_01211100 [Mycena chlorophos]
MPTQYRCCACPLNDGVDHMVHKRARVQHLIDIQAREMELSVVAPDSVEQLGSLFTGLVVSDEGVEPRLQTHSRLFSSREEFQKDVPDAPTAFVPLSDSETFRGAAAILLEPLRASEPVSDPVPPLQPPIPRSQQEALAFLTVCLQRVIAAREKLDLAHSLDANADGLAAALDAATTAVVDAGRLISSIKLPPERPAVRASRRNTRIDTTLKDLVEKVRSEARLLDGHIDVVGALVPTPVLVEEVEYNSEHHFVNPVGRYDTVTQVTIFLVAVCHILVGVSTNPCNFIIQVLQLIIRLSMSIGSPSLEPNPKQEDVLKQLPTSLENALRRFKLDPKTVVYAVCPSCHYLHKPRTDRLTGDVVYVDTCQGFVYPKDGLAVRCNEPLLKLRQGKLRPLKPYVYASFVDYLAAMLADADIEEMCEKACDNALAAVQKLSANATSVAEDERKREVGVAFFHQWVEYDAATCHPDYRVKNPAKEIAQIRRLHLQLTQPVLPHEQTDQPMPAADSLAPIAITSKQLRDNLAGNNVPALRFVAHSLGLDLTGVSASERLKKPYIDRLVAWRYLKPLSDDNYAPRAIDMTALKFIQRVIADTETPAWIGAVPVLYGENNPGTIKAAEWRILATVYLPIALVLLWGDHLTPEKRALDILDHSMDLFSAVGLVCRYTMTRTRARQYRDLLKRWVEGLPIVHPHTRAHPVRPNVHVAFHIYEFLILFGPIVSWWCFPFERVIGYLQRINTNDHIGGELEGTLTKSFFRAAALRRWLRRPDCPRVIQELRGIFDKTFPAYNAPSDSDPAARDGDRARYTRNGTTFARASTHLGDSLVLYYPPNSNVAVPGSIEHISSVGNEVRFEIRPQASLRRGMLDPFKRYPLFPASTYSAKMGNYTDTVPRKSAAASMTTGTGKGAGIVADV